MTTFESPALSLVGFVAEILIFTFHFHNYSNQVLHLMQIVSWLLNYRSIISPLLRDRVRIRSFVYGFSNDSMRTIGLLVVVFDFKRFVASNCFVIFDNRFV